MPAQTIQSQDISVSGIFQSFYAVPDYQREYVWQSDQVEQLLSDINAEIDYSNNGESPEYFIGSIVVCKSDRGIFDLIDGQQRMTTLYILLCAIRDRAKVLAQNPPGTINFLIAAPDTDARGQDTYRYRLDLQYEDSGTVLVDLADGKALNIGTTPTSSIENISNAYKTCANFLTREFGENMAALRIFFGYVTNKVKLIRIETESVAKALKIFETINDRGVGLNSMDLLKNLLFMKARTEDFRKLKEVWKRLQDAIYTMEEKPLRFLRYYILANHDIEVLREEDIYDWFVRNERECGYSQHPLKFAETLLDAASAYGHFLSGRDHHGQSNRFLQNIKMLGGKSARQHLIILLAGRHLTSDQFDELCKEVENLFFCYVITRESTRDFERNFARWSTELRGISDQTSFENFLNEHFSKTKRDLSVRFDEAFSRLHTDAIQFYRLRYILAKLTQYVDMQGFGVIDGTQSLSRYTDGVDIEHVFPQNPNEAARREFGMAEEMTSGFLGNLVLAEPAINRALGNEPYSTKRPVYGQSQYLLTRVLAQKVQVGTNTAMDRAIAELETYDKWNTAAIAKRQGELAKLARKTWDIPK